MQTFKNAIQLAKWIKSQNLSELNQEKLMRIGIDNKRFFGFYCITDSNMYSVTKFTLNGDMANQFNESQEEDFMDYYQEDWGGL